MGFFELGGVLMKKLLVSVFSLCLIVCVVNAAAAQNLLFNGNLDQTFAELIVDNAPPGPGPEDFYLPKPLGWVNEGFRAITGPYEDEMSSEPWAGPAPTPVTTDGSGLPGPDGCNGQDCGVFFKPFSGNAQNGAATGHLYQDVPATPGLLYTLTGWAGAEANALMAGAEIALEFLDGGGIVIGGDVVDLLPTLFIPNGEPFDYKQYTASAVAPAGTIEARARVSMLGGIGNPLGGGQAFVVDDFTLTAIPEPSSLLLAGLSLIGCLGIRRRG
jgi:hypothetical protein